MSRIARPPSSLDKWFENQGPKPYWLDESRFVGVFPDEFPAPGALHHMIVMVRTPVASRSGIRLPWSNLEPQIRTRANDLVDGLMGRLRSETGEHTVVIESNRRAIEPHRHILVGDKPQTIFNEDRIGNPDYAITPQKYAATAGLLGAVGVKDLGQQLFVSTDWSPLLRPSS